ncbi:Hypothetical predicted protein [Pelobates cultripes]|uniref:Uncharacterized protein n=1 Tax=Pelobates cultripes TaxID=61616 RepID=A0AAD1SVE7_PELCU|nr:Hypothetical predicted protein [Pelobates cultripes]
MAEQTLEELMAGIQDAARDRGMDWLLEQLGAVLEAAGQDGCGDPASGTAEETVATFEPGSRGCGGCWDRVGCNAGVSVGAQGAAGDGYMHTQLPAQGLLGPQGLVGAAGPSHGGVEVRSACRDQGSTPRALGGVARSEMAQSCGSGRPHFGGRRARK